MQNLWQWIVGLDWQDIIVRSLGSLIGALLGVLAGWLLIFRRRWLELRRLQRGESNDVLFQAHVLLPVDDSEDAVVLVFRNVGPQTTIDALYDNLAARAAVKKISDKTTLEYPILQTQGKVGFEVLNTALGYIAGHLAVSPFERDRWLFVMTCEDRQVVRKKCLRCFLIRPADLERFQDWDWCRNKIRVEKPWHNLRIATLHRIAQSWNKEKERTKEEEPTSALQMPLVDDLADHDRIRELSLGINTKEAYVGSPVAADFAALEKKLQELGIQWNVDQTAALDAS